MACECVDEINQAVADIDAHSDSLMFTINEHSDSLEGTIIEHIDVNTNNINTWTTSAVAGLFTGVNNLITWDNSYGQTIDTVLTNLTTFQGAEATHYGSMVSLIAGLGTQLATTYDQLNESIETTEDRTGTIISDTIPNAVLNINNNSNAIYADVNTAIDHAIGLINQHSDSLMTTINEHTDSISTIIDNHTDVSVNLALSAIGALSAQVAALSDLVTAAFAASGVRNWTVNP